MSLMSERRSIYSRRKTPIRTRIIPQLQRTTIPRGTILARRPGVSMRRPGLSMRERPIIPISTRPGVTIRPRPSISIRSFIPTVGATAPLSAQPGGGLPTPSVTGGLGLGTITGDIQAFGGNIVERFRALIPITIKIIAAVIVIKIVLWLMRGRRR